MELDSRKKSRRESMIRSKSFAMQEMREMAGRKQESREAFPILWMGIIEDVFQMERNAKRRKD